MAFSGNKLVSPAQSILADKVNHPFGLLRTALASAEHVPTEVADGASEKGNTRSCGLSPEIVLHTPVKSHDVIGAFELRL